MQTETVALSVNFANGLGFNNIYPATSVKDIFQISPDIQDTSFDQTDIIEAIRIALGINDKYSSESFLMMLATERVLKIDWDSPEEDEAWAGLLRER